MKITADGFEFDFTDALDAFIFDEKNSNHPHFHGAPMKAVDIIVELDKAYLFVEMKNYDDPKEFEEEASNKSVASQVKHDGFRWLKNYLKYKYRDSYLYRHAEGKIGKPVHYICLLTFDNPLNSRMQKALKKELPVGKASKNWKTEIAASCQVLNVKRWNANFPAWPLRMMVV